ncbi:MAG: carbohydrate binding domain-containing protein [Bacteroidaceae bacterium]|nr:carbohydrate binding domain-containing protein [Bacteroidaceae bacterium]
MKKDILLCGLTFLCALCAQSQVTIDVDLTSPGHPVSPTLYGIFFEDINHAADGGLYAELIRNRSFEELRSDHRRERVVSPEDTSAPLAWQSFGGSTIALTTEGMLNEAQQHALQLSVTQPGGGVENLGYWGMQAVNGNQYTLSLWVRAAQGNPGRLTASLVGHDGQTLGEAVITDKIGKKWAKVEARFVATGDDPEARFRLTAERPCQLVMDVVSLFPPTFKNRPNGMRPQLAQMLADMHPKFMRFPGGCFVEGQVGPENAYHWQRTVGPIEQRPGHLNANWTYWVSDGLGFHEYLQLAEDLGAKPLYVVNVGIWHGGFTPVEELDPWIQECLDALEYANGDAKTTKFGRMRAENGHPEPFNIEYLEIGNENANFFFDNNRDQSERYHERYRKFYDAVKARYPNIQCIGNVEAWGTDRPSWRSQEPVDMLDEHYYRNPRWFTDAYDKYDHYDRQGPRIYVGEYAVTSQFGKVGNQNAALGEAVYMLGMENNSDIVAMASYAPIFVNDNASNWPTDMIHFNAEYAFGTPSYWVQNLFSNHVGTRTVPQTLQWRLPEPQAVEATQPLHVAVGTWATQAEYREPQLIVDGQAYDLPDLSAWKHNRGREPHLEVCPVEFQGQKYTYRVKARKTGGNEGFLLVYNYQNERDFDWFNVGGWGNSQNAIEQSVDGGRINIGQEQPFRVEEGRWYDLRVEVDGDSMATYIDDQLCITARHKNPNMRGIYSNSTLDEQTRTLYIKVVNVGEGGAQGCINLSGGLAERAGMVRLASERGQDENTRRDPQAIHPRHIGVFVDRGGAQLKFPVAPFSVNILTVKLK